MSIKITQDHKFRVTLAQNNLSLTVLLLIITYQVVSECDSHGLGCVRLQMGFLRAVQALTAKQ